MLVRPPSLRRIVVRKWTMIKRWGFLHWKEETFFFPYLLSRMKLSLFDPEQWGLEKFLFVARCWGCQLGFQDKKNHFHRKLDCRTFVSYLFPPQDVLRNHLWEGGDDEMSAEKSILSRMRELGTWSDSDGDFCVGKIVKSSKRGAMTPIWLLGSQGHSKGMK